MDTNTFLLDIVIANNKKLDPQSANEVVFIKETFSSLLIDNLNAKIDVISNIARSTRDASITEVLANLIIESSEWENKLQYLLLSASPTSAVLDICKLVLKEKQPKHPLVNNVNVGVSFQLFDALIKNEYVHCDIDFESNLGAKFLFLNFENPLNSWFVGVLIEKSGNDSKLSIEETHSFEIDKTILPPMLVFPDVIIEREKKSRKSNLKG